MNKKKYLYSDDECTIDDESPCIACNRNCDGWDKIFCCRLCEYEGRDDCENCDPWDI